MNYVAHIIYLICILIRYNNLIFTIKADEAESAPPDRGRKYPIAPDLLK